MKKEFSWKFVNAFINSKVENNCINALWIKFNEWEFKESKLFIIYNDAKQLLHSKRLYNDKI